MTRTLKNARTARSTAAQAVTESAQKIWLAGLGAFAQVQRSGGRLFEALVAEGEKVEARSRKRLDAQVKSAEHKVDAVRARASGGLDRLEKVFERRVERALPRIGVASRGDLKALAAQVKALNAQVARIGAEREPAGRVDAAA